MPITALYAAALSLLFIVLSFRTIGQRRASKVEIGDGGDRDLLRRVRVHANFAEYTPMALVLLGLAESLHLPALGLHGIGMLLLLGRVTHAYGLSQTPHNIRLRVAGMVMTLNAIMAAALACAALSVMSMSFAL